MKRRVKQAIIIKHTMNKLISSRDNINQIAQESIKILNTGGIVLLPFDTVYGLICDPKNFKSIEKIFQLKGRDRNKTVGLAVSSMSELNKIAHLTLPDFIKEKIPGRYTFIVRSNENIFSPQCYRGDTLGVRVPNSSLILKIVSSFGPIAQTSANKSGQTNCYSVVQIESQFTNDELSSIDLIIDGGEIEHGQPSEIWDVTGTCPIKIER